MKRLYACVLGLFFLLLAWPAQAQWTNEPAGSQQIADCPMTNGVCNSVVGNVAPGRWYDLYGNMQVSASDPSDPISPPSVLDSVLPYSGPCSNGGTSSLPCAIGGGQIGYIDNKADRELFVGLYFKVNAGYSCSLVGKSKVFFMRSLDNMLGFAQSNGVFMIEGCGTTKTVHFSHNSNNINNSHTCALDLGLTCFPNAGNSSFQAGSWVKIEACIRSSSTLTSRDGVLKWWVNGTLAGNYTNFNYGNGNVNEFVQNETWDGWGNGQGFTSEAHQMFAHIHVSVPPNGGCLSGTGGGGGSDLTPPSRVGNVTVTQLN